MIFVIKENGKSKEVKERNNSLQEIVDEAVKGKQYGKVVTTQGDLIKDCKANDTKLYIFAHGNHKQLGCFSETTNLMKHIVKEINPFGKKTNNARITEIFLFA